MRRSVVTGLIAVGAVLVGCAEGERGDVDVVEAYVEAFNARDVDAMLSHVAPGANWIGVTGTRATPITSGRDALREALLAYSAEQPTARSALLSASRHGDFVQTFEQATWEHDDGTQRRCAVAVYELDSDDRIKNVWYFDARDCAP